MTLRIEQSVAAGQLKYTELFLFIDILVVEIALYEGKSKLPLLFDIVLVFNKVQMQGGLSCMPSTLQEQV